MPAGASFSFFSRLVPEVNLWGICGERNAGLFCAGHFELLCDYRNKLNLNYMLTPDRFFDAVSEKFFKLERKKCFKVAY